MGSASVGVGFGYRQIRARHPPSPSPPPMHEGMFCTVSLTPGPVITYSIRESCIFPSFFFSHLFHTRVGVEERWPGLTFFFSLLVFVCFFVYFVYLFIRLILEQSAR